MYKRQEAAGSEAGGAEADGEEQSAGDSSGEGAAEAEVEAGGATTPCAEELFVEISLHAASEAKGEALAELQRLGLAMPEWMAAALAN